MHIFKYRVKTELQVQIIQLPIGATPLSVQEQYGVVQIWFLVDQNQPLGDFELIIMDTGQFVKELDPKTFIDTVQCGAYVHHIFGGWVE